MLGKFLGSRIEAGAQFAVMEPTYTLMYRLSMKANRASTLISAPLHTSCYPAIQTELYGY
jgi:hypothetical protein